MKISLIFYPVNLLILITVLTSAGCSDAEMDKFFLGEAYPARAMTKLNSSGNPLPDQTKTWNTNDATASEANSDRWSCVRDDESGLIFEIKTHDNGLRDYRHKYTWYNSNAATNLGEHGIGDLGIGVTTNYQVWHAGEVFAGSDACFDKNRCDIEKYVADVNAAGLCGANDWSMPTSTELGLLLTGSPGLYTVNFRSAHINVKYFPEAYDYRLTYQGTWTGSNKTSTGIQTESGIENAASIDFGNGLKLDELKETQFHLRLVRKPNP